MGWLDDFVSNPIATVSNTVNREVSNFSNSVNAVVADAPRGDIGKFVADSAVATVNIAKAPFEVAYYGFRGDNTGVSRSIQRAVGSSMNLQGTQNGNLFNNETLGIRAVQSDVGQAVLRNPGVRESTFGLSEDYAGLYRGSRTLQDSAYLSREDQNSAIRLGVKGAVFAGGAAAYSEWSGLQAADKAKYASYFTGGSAIFGAAAKGDAKGAAKALSDLTGAPDLSEYLPGPAQDVPSYISNPKSGGSVGYAAPQVSDPWDIKGIADSGIAAVTDPTKLPIIIGVGFLGYLLYRRFK